MAGTSPTPSPPACHDKKRLIAIGNFDGVHCGHQSLVQAVVREAKQRELRPAVLTFDPHPSEVLGRGALPRLTRLDQKLRLLRQLSPELEVLVHRFDRMLAAMSPAEFAQQLLVEQYAAGRVIVGANFRFGHGRAGTLEVLQALGEELGFSAAALPLLEAAGEAISSSRIRALIARGDMHQATRLLGRPHELRGRVVAGEALGRALGFPTANLNDIAEMLPAQGVYACRVRVVGENQFRAAVANVGVRPTVSNDTERPPGVEVHLIDHTCELYGRSLDVRWEQRLRAEQRFASLDELREQIVRDVGQASRILSATSYAPPP